MIACVVHFLLPLILLLPLQASKASENAMCDAISNPTRLDCHPEPMASEEACLQRNCCWSLVDHDRTIACYFPLNYPTYNPIGKVERTSCGLKVNAKRSPGAYSVIPDPVEEVQLSVIFCNS